MLSSALSYSFTNGCFPRPKRKKPIFPVSGWLGTWWNWVCLTVWMSCPVADWQELKERLVLCDGVCTCRAPFLPREAANSSPFSSGMGDHPEDLCIHQPHCAPRGPGALACRAGGKVASSTFGNHLWDKSEAFRCKSFWKIHTPFENEALRC